MKGYKTFKTTMGHKIRVRMSEEEMAERELFWLSVTVFPFLTGILFFLVWVKAG